MPEKECYVRLNVRLLLTTIKHKSTGHRYVQIQYTNTYHAYKDLELKALSGSNSGLQL